MSSYFDRHRRERIEEENAYSELQAANIKTGLLDCELDRANEHIETLEAKIDACRQALADIAALHNQYGSDGYSTSSIMANIGNIARHSLWEIAAIHVCHDHEMPADENGECIVCREANHDQQQT